MRVVHARQGFEGVLSFRYYMSQSLKIKFFASGISIYFAFFSVFGMNFVSDSIQ